MRIRGWSLWALVFLTACSTTHENPVLPLKSEQDIRQSVDRFTETKRIYDGFQSVMEFSVTLHNSEVKDALLDHSARIYQWNADQYSGEKNKSEAEKTRFAEVFLSFFTPERKHDDLHRGETKWKIFLDVSGRRYEGKAKKMKTIMADVKSQYPRHTRWNTPYKIQFPLPTTDLDGREVRFTLTGPVGSSTVSFGGNAPTPTSETGAGSVEPTKGPSPQNLLARKPSRR